MSHGGVTVDFLRSNLGDALVEEMAPGVIEFGLPGACLTELAFDGSRFAAVVIADVNHLAVHERSGHKRA